MKDLHGGTLAEIGYCLHVASRLGYITNETLSKFESELNGVGAPLAGLIRSTRLMPAVIPILALFCGALLGRFIW
ncbi:MAG TPA: hypothetical protein VGJ39_14445 [Vicinamibacterales bacterium]